jgi:hypothetical protein
MEETRARLKCRVRTVAERTSTGGDIMRSIGGLLFFLGVGSIVLQFMNYEFVVLSWMNNLNPPLPWVIRIGLIVVGAILWFLGRKK